MVARAWSSLVLELQHRKCLVKNDSPRFDGVAKRSEQIALEIARADQDVEARCGQYGVLEIGSPQSQRQTLPSSLDSSVKERFNVSIDTERFEPCAGQYPGMTATAHRHVQGGHGLGNIWHQPIDPPGDERRR